MINIFCGDKSIGYYITTTTISPQIIPIADDAIRIDLIDHVEVTKGPLLCAQWIEYKYLWAAAVH